MKAIVTFEYGEASYTFEIEERTDMETLLKTIVLGNPPRSCKLIPNGKYQLEAKQTKEGYIYIDAVCIGTVNGQFKVAKSNLGTYLNNKGYFWKAWEFDEWADKRLAGEQAAAPRGIDPRANATTTIQKPQYPVSTEEEISDIPF